METEYRHGGDVYRNQNIQYDFSINLNPFGMPEFVRDAAIEGVLKGSRYPDSGCGRLRTLVSSYYKVPESELIFGNGAAELIYGIVRALRPKRAALLAPTFSEYEHALRAEGAEICCFFLKEEEGFALSPEDYLEFLKREQPELIFLCNPANPVGNLMDGAAMDQILRFCRERDIFVVVDECFLDFTEAGEGISAVRKIRDGYRNLFVLQALTKSFAMAGLRLGYGFCKNKGILKSMESHTQPWNVSVVAQEAGAAAFGPEREIFLARTREFLRTEQGYLKDKLKAAGFCVFDSDANFLLFKDQKGRAERELYTFLLDRGILIRCCDDYHGLDGTCYRICVRSREENDRLLEYIGEYL